MNKNLLIVPLFFLASILNAEVVYTFDTAANLTGNFAQTGTAWAHTVSGGNTGGFANPASGTATGFNTENRTFSLDLSKDQSFTIRADVRTAVNLFPRNNYLNLSLGITTASAIGYAGGGLLDSTSLIAGLVAKTDNIDASTGGPTNTYGYHFGAGHTSAGIQITLGSVDNLATNTWYQLITNWTYTDATNSFTLNLVLKSADGLTVIRNLTFSSAYTNPWGADDTIVVHSFFGGRESLNAGIFGVDNFVGAAAPEAPAPILAATGVSGGQLQISCPSQAGFSYQLKTSSGLSGFLNDGAPQNGTGGNLLFTPAAPAAGQAAFHVVEVTPN